MLSSLGGRVAGGGGRAARRVGSWWGKKDGGRSFARRWAARLFGV